MDFPRWVGKKWCRRTCGRWKDRCNLPRQIRHATGLEDRAPPNPSPYPRHGRPHRRGPVRFRPRRGAAGQRLHLRYDQGSVHRQEAGWGDRRHFQERRQVAGGQQQCQREVRVQRRLRSGVQDRLQQDGLGKQELHGGHAQRARREPCRWGRHEHRDDPVPGTSGHGLLDPEPADRQGEVLSGEERPGLGLGLHRADPERGEPPDQGVQRPAEERGQR